MQIQIARLPDRVEARLAGPIDTPAVLEMLRELGAVTRSHGDKLLLMDLLLLEGEVPLAAQLQVGEQIAHSMAHLQRMASVVAPDRLTRTSEKVARAQGLQFTVFDSKDEAISWLCEPAGPDTEPAAESAPMDPSCTAIWTAVRHLFPPHSQAIQLPSGTLAISWSIANQPGAVYEMATPITVRLEPELAEALRLANPEQRKRIATHQESAVRAGLVGYDPFTTVPRARVIVLG
ncbi:hypothetical protein [uncultured Ramlibacter sp.]|uniref:hypothetical protein n=1 Tax=uncultured Ramlibacter sp. TaxID=260755 RepID=UPI002608F51F|nr:hypothetical protein [uncultured Ramlibacter sp.]